MIAVLGYGWWLQPRHTTLDEAVAELVDGDADRDERLVCLAVVRDRGLEAAQRGEAGAALLSAMAALALDDRETFATASLLARGKTPYLPGGKGAPPAPETLRQATLGEPYLRTLMLGYAAESRGDLPKARRFFAQAHLSALFFGAKEAAAVAR